MNTILNKTRAAGNVPLRPMRTAAIPLFLLCMMGSAVFLTACGQTCFAGSRAAEPGFYRLDIDCMTGTDRFTMELSAGDMLAVQFET